jgi:hypothetical protein
MGKARARKQDGLGRIIRDSQNFITQLSPGGLGTAPDLFRLELRGQN